MCPFPAGDPPRHLGHARPACGPAARGAPGGSRTRNPGGLSAPSLPFGPQGPSRQVIGPPPLSRPPRRNPPEPAPKGTGRPRTGQTARVRRAPPPRHGARRAADPRVPGDPRLVRAVAGRRPGRPDRGRRAGVRAHRVLAFAVAATLACSYLTWLVGGPLLSSLADRLPAAAPDGRLRRAARRAGRPARAPRRPAGPGLRRSPRGGPALAPLRRGQERPPPRGAARRPYVVGNALQGAVFQGAQVAGFLLGGALVAATSAPGRPGPGRRDVPAVRAPARRLGARAPAARASAHLAARRHARRGDPGPPGALAAPPAGVRRSSARWS